MIDAADKLCEEAEYLQWCIEQDERALQDVRRRLAEMESEGRPAIAYGRIRESLSSGRSGDGPVKEPVVRGGGSEMTPSLFPERQRA